MRESCVSQRIKTVGAAWGLSFELALRLLLVWRCDLRSAGSTGRRERAAAGQRSGPGTRSASWRQGEETGTRQPVSRITRVEHKRHKSQHVGVCYNRGVKRRREWKQTLQTGQVFRSLIISTNKLPHYRHPLWSRAKVRNASPLIQWVSLITPTTTHPLQDPLINSHTAREAGPPAWQKSPHPLPSSCRPLLHRETFKTHRTPCRIYIKPFYLTNYPNKTH